MMAIERTLSGLAAGIAISLPVLTATFAHAHLLQATPSVGGTVHEPPREGRVPLQ